MSGDQAPPHREVSDPAALRALAHPVRWRLLHELARRGPATAADLADRIGDSQANCSWHLRQLHRYGFIEEAAGGTVRRRPWQLVRQTFNLRLSGTEESDAPHRIAAEAMWEVLIDRDVQDLREWRVSQAGDEPDWREAATEQEIGTWLTAEELAAFTAELGELAQRHLAHWERVDPARRPPGCRPVTFVAWTTPGPPDTETLDTETPDTETPEDPAT